MSIHQPSSNIYEMFDNLVLLAQGELVYFGSSKDALTYFEALNHSCPNHYNPADYLLDLVTMNSVAQVRGMAMNYRNEHQSKVLTSYRACTPEGFPEDMFDDLSEYATSPYEQVWCLSVRTMKHNFRNPFLLRTQYLMTLLLGLAIGFIYWKGCTLNLEGIQNRVGILFFSASLLTFSSMSSIDTCKWRCWETGSEQKGGVFLPPLISTFSTFFFFVVFQERSLFLRERANGMYRTSSYFLAKTLCDILPMRVFPALIFATVTFWMVGYQTGAKHFIIYASVLVLVSVASGSMCLAISSFVPTLSVGNLIAIVVMLVNMLFGGFLVNRLSMPAFIGWIRHASFLNFGYEILVVNELTGLIFRVDAAGLPPGVVDVTYDGV
jgi:hypothetical protein